MTTWCPGAGRLADQTAPLWLVVDHAQRLPGVQRQLMRTWLWQHAGSSLLMLNRQVRCDQDEGRRRAGRGGM